MRVTAAMITEGFDALLSHAEPPSDFLEMIYAAIESDPFLCVMGGVLNPKGETVVAAARNTAYTLCATLWVGMWIERQRKDINLLEQMFGETK